MTCGNRLLKIALVLLTGLATSIAWAGPYDPPPAYYSGATGTGATLKTQLTAAMSAGHIQRTYGNFRDSAAIHDADPNNPGNILLVYNRASVSATWDQGATWNREHVWPQSLQPGSASTSSTGNLGDPHALRPADPGINSSRSNKPFGLDNTTGSFGSQGAYYFPGDADKGDIARQLFYSDTRWSSLGISLVDTEDPNLPGSNQMGDLSALIAWHYLDTPDEFEQRRNHTIFSQAENPLYYTNNRSAFVDRPEFVWSVYVDQENDSQLYVGGAPAGDGSSTLAVDLGPVIVGAAVPAAQNVTLHKNGFDGSYYEVTTTGDATSSVTGRFNAFAISASSTDSTTLSVGLNATTGVAGQQNGSVMIDNLDVTTAGGAGRGANDADDTINVSLDVFDHANPSFLGGSDLNMLTIDFGTVAQGGASPTMDFDIFNLINTASFTASLELDSILGSGDTGVLTTDLATFTGGSALAAGANNMFTATLDTSGVGSFSATYTLSFSDEDLSGASALGDLTLNLLGEVTGSVENANFNGDSFVDGEDFLIWQRGFGVGTTLAEGDANDDNLVNATDLAIWESQYGTAALSAAVSVPEPCTLLLVMGSGLLVFVRRRPAHGP